MSSSTAAALADRLEQTSATFAAYLGGLSPDQWRSVCGNHPTIRIGDEDEHRPVGTVAHHTAVAVGRMGAMLSAIVNGEEMPRPDPARAALHARDFADADQAETIELLRENTAQTAAQVRALSDEELERTGQTMIGEMNASQLVDRVIIGHIHWHQGSIEATLGHPMTSPGPRLGQST